MDEDGLACAIRRWPFVRYLPGSGARAASDEIFNASGGYPRIITESSDTEYVKRIVSLGLGLSLVPLFTIQAELKAGSLRALAVKGCCVIQEFGLVFRKGFRPLLIDRFADVCVGISREQPKSYLLRKRPKRKRRVG